METKSCGKIIYVDLSDSPLTKLASWESDLVMFLQQFGRISKTLKKGVQFLVQFESEEAASRALHLNGHPIHGQRLNVADSTNHTSKDELISEYCCNVSEARQWKNVYPSCTIQVDASLSESDIRRTLMDFVVVALKPQPDVVLVELAGFDDAAKAIMAINRMKEFSSAAFTSMSIPVERKVSEEQARDPCLENFEYL